MHFAKKQYRSVRRPSFRFDHTTISLEPRLMPSADVLTYHNDNARTGLTSNESILNLQNVNSHSFGKVRSLPVDGQVYAQPLYKSNVSIPGQGVHNVVYIATEHDSIYAFDADNYTLLWHDSFIDPAHGVTTVPNTDLGEFDLLPEIGITSTPVIDATTNTIYLVDKLKVQVGAKALYAQQLIALDIATGAFRNGGPTNITATAPGRGAGSLHGKVAFDPLGELQRSALLLRNGVVYLAFSVQATSGSTHGWFMAYNSQNLSQLAAFNVTPNGTLGGIWMNGDGPSADAAGNIYLATGDGTFSANKRGRDYGSSVLKFTPAPGLKVTDYFTPSNQAYLGSHDLDFGSGGVVLLPDQPGTNPHLLVVADKTGKVYLLNRDKLGKFTSKDRAVRELANALVASFDTPAYFNNTIYYVGTNERTGGSPDVLRAFKLVNGLINPTPTTGTFTYGYPGSSPTISANGSSDGIVWTVDNGDFALHGPAILRANEADNVSHQIYASNENGTQDKAGGAVKFVVPTVANGKVYLGGNHTVTIFGLKPN